MNANELLSNEFPISLKNKIDDDFIFILSSLMKNKESLNSKLILELDEIIEAPTNQKKQELLEYWASKVSNLRSEQENEDLSYSDDAII